MFGSIITIVGVFALMSQLWRLGATGIVHRVIDGDTIEANLGGRIVRVRISNIDSPEWDMPWGRAARSELAHFARVGSTVRLGFSRTDRYGRRVCKLSIAGVDLGSHLARKGLAHGSTFRTARLAAAARLAGIGLWSDPHPIHPAMWRKANRVQGRTSRFAGARA